MKYPPIDGAPARNSDPWTSHVAAALVPATMLEKMFLDALATHPHLTTTEIARLYGMERDSFSPRPEALKRKKLIVQDGYRIVPNKAGHLRKMIAFRLLKNDGSDPLPAPPRETARRLRMRIRDLELALQQIASHPMMERKEDGSSYTTGWAFWNMQRIARAALGQDQ